MPRYGMHEWSTPFLDPPGDPEMAICLTSSGIKECGGGLRILQGYTAQIDSHRGFILYTVTYTYIVHPPTQKELTVAYFQRFMIIIH